MWICLPGLTLQDVFSFDVTNALFPIYRLHVLGGLLHIHSHLRVKTLSNQIIKALVACSLVLEIHSYLQLIQSYHTVSKH